MESGWTETLSHSKILATVLLRERISFISVALAVVPLYVGGVESQHDAAGNIHSHYLLKFELKISTAIGP
jgi:hypothetical protein